MRRRSRINLLLAMSFALLATTVSAVPATAETVLQSTGTQGYWYISDVDGGPRGATCSYEKVSYDLDKMRVKHPLMHGYYSANTKVEWRFKIRRASPSSMTFNLIYTSSWQTDRANNAIPADGFTDRPWTAPENVSGKYQVLVEMRWWYAGNVDGFVRAEIDFYKAKWNGISHQSEQYCLESY